MPVESQLADGVVIGRIGLCGPGGVVLLLFPFLPLPPGPFGQQVFNGKPLLEGKPPGSSAEQHRVYYTTTMAGGSAVCEALGFTRGMEGEIKVRSLQSLHKEIN